MLRKWAYNDANAEANRTASKPMISQQIRAITLETDGKSQSMPESRTPSSGGLNKEKIVTSAPNGLGRISAFA